MLDGIQQAFQDLFHDPAWFTIRFLILVIAISLHEFGHAAVAVSCGDPTPRNDGRVTLNPLVHLDPIGTVGLLFWTFGWGKPVMVSPGYFRGKWDHVKVAFAGPFMNIVQAFVFGLSLRTLVLGGVHVGPVAYSILLFGMQINVGLAVFNLIPIGPLDGATILKGFLPLRAAYDFEQFNRQWGLLLMFGLFFTPFLGELIGPVERVFSTLILGRFAS